MAIWVWRDSSKIKALVALLEVLGSIPAPTDNNASPRGYDALFWPLQVPAMNMVHRYALRQYTYIHKINLNIYILPAILKELFKIFFLLNHCLFALDIKVRNQIVKL